MKARLGAILIVAVLLLAGCGGGGGGGDDTGGGNVVKITDNGFEPSTLTIKSGDTVRFRWTGSLPHDVVITKGPGISRTKTISKVRTRGTVSKKFNTKGTYSILCRIHRPNMKMKIKVT